MNFKQTVSIATSLVLLTSSLYSENWSSTQNEHGFILKSDNKTLYLGKSCDATSPQYGTGEWYWKGNKVIVSLSNKDFSFNSGSLYADGRCQKGSISNKSTSLPALPYHWIYDQNGCKHYNPEPRDDETITWTGSCKNGYADGHGTLIWYHNAQKGSTQKGSKSEGKFYDKDSSHDAELAGAAIGVAALAWLFGVGRDKSSSSSSSSYSSSSSSSNEPCYSGDNTCYKITDKRHNGSVIYIECTKGNVGYTTSVCSDDDGDWSTSCTLGSYHYKSFHEAVNRYCQ